MPKQFGACVPGVFNWEANTPQPDFRYMPAVIKFLGYNPLPEATTPAEELVRHRTVLGLFQNEAAKRIGVDQSTLAKWERGEREVTGRFLGRVMRFLEQAATQSARARCAG